MTQTFADRSAPPLQPNLPAETVCLTIPGLNGSGPDHWQSRWEARPDCARVDLGNWEDPDRDLWRFRLDAAIRGQPGRVVLAAHSLGCLTVASWAAFAPVDVAAKVRGALLVAPPHLDGRKRLGNFSSLPGYALPFRSILVSSSSDPYATPLQSRAMARLWGSDHVDLGDAGHINAASGLGDWPEGQALLAGLAKPDWAERASGRLLRHRQRWQTLALRPASHKLSPQHAS